MPSTSSSTVVVAAAYSVWSFDDPDWREGTLWCESRVEWRASAGGAYTAVVVAIHLSSTRRDHRLTIDQPATVCGPLSGALFRCVSCVYASMVVASHRHQYNLI